MAFVLLSRRFWRQDNEKNEGLLVKTGAATALILLIYSYYCPLNF